MAKELSFENQSRIRLKNGIDKLANAVKATLGPKGRTVVFGTRYMGAMTTKDGVTVARHIELPDEVENLGAMMIREAASQTADNAGDGTTTATVLAQAIIDEGMRALSQGASPIEIKRGIDKAAKFVLSNINDSSIKIELSNDKISQIARISANNDDEIGSIIAEAMRIAGENGTIAVEEAKGMDTSVNKVQGTKLDKGFISPYFQTNPEKQIAEFDNPYILLCMDRIGTVASILPIMEKVVKMNRPIVIVAKDVEGEALSAMILNKAKGVIQCAAVKTPGFGDVTKDIMEDLAVVTGARIIASTEGMSLDTVTLDDLGAAERIIISKEETTIINGRGNPVALENRMNSIKETIAACANEYEKKNLTMRLAKLAGGVAVLYIGAATEIEMKEKKDRVDDALCATRAALEEGIVPGGGTIFLKSSKNLDIAIRNNAIQFNTEAEKYGANVLRDALKVPIRQIAMNAGASPDVVMHFVTNNTDPNFGYDAYNDSYCDLINAGIIDPAKVLRVALENAVSVAGMFLTTECVISDIKEDAVKIPQSRK